MPARWSGCSGDNGAGKSTLIKIITGVHQPDEGEILFDGRPVTGLDRRSAHERSASRPSSRSAPSRSSCRSGATSSWAARSAGRFGFLRVGEMRRVTTERLMSESMGFTSAVADARHAGDRTVGRRAPGPRDRPRAPLRGRHHHPRRADDGPVAEGDREAPALRGRHPGGRQVGASSSTTTSSTSIRWPTGSCPGPRPGGGRLPDLALLARRADGDHARGRVDGRLRGA